MKFITDWANSLLVKYQKQISKYDKHQWESSIDDPSTKLRNIPTKSTTVTNDFIDIDLVRGSAFPKPKPKYGWFEVSRPAIMRVLFLPYYYSWWKHRTSLRLAQLFLLLYLTQIISTFFMLASSIKLHVTFFEAHSHILLIFIVSIIHCKCIAMQGHTRYRDFNISGHGKNRQGKKKKKAFLTHQRRKEASEKLDSFDDTPSSIEKTIAPPTKNTPLFSRLINDIGGYRSTSVSTVTTSTNSKMTSSSGTEIRVNSESADKYYYTDNRSKVSSSLSLDNATLLKDNTMYNIRGQSCPPPSVDIANKQHCSEVVSNEITTIRKHSKVKNTSVLLIRRFGEHKS